MNFPTSLKAFTILVCIPLLFSPVFEVRSENYVTIRVNSGKDDAGALKQARSFLRKNRSLTEPVMMEIGDERYLLSVGDTATVGRIILFSLLSERHALVGISTEEKVIREALELAALKDRARVAQLSRSINSGNARDFKIAALAMLGKPAVLNPKTLQGRHLLAEKNSEGFELRHTEVPDVAIQFSGRLANEARGIVYNLARNDSPREDVKLKPNEKRKEEPKPDQADEKPKPVPEENEKQETSCRVTKITVREHPKISPGITAFNYDFSVQIVVEGSRLTHCDIRMLIVIEDERKDYDGQKVPESAFIKTYPPELRGELNSGIPATDSGWDWQPLKDDTRSEHRDDQKYSIDRRSMVENGTLITRVHLSKTTRKFTIQIRDREREHKPIISEHEWAYTWDNYNTKANGEEHGHADIDYGRFSGLVNLEDPEKQLSLQKDP